MDLWKFNPSVVLTDQNTIVQNSTQNVKTNAYIKMWSIPNDSLREIVENDNLRMKTCEACSNHPKNGGSGICNCVLGLKTVIS